MSEVKPRVAYFCMEYGIHQDLKTYAGGLGILAGDYLKGAKDHDYPIVGLGIRWKQGYGDQWVNDQGKAYHAFQNFEYDFLEDTGVEVEVMIREREVRAKVWKLDKFGHVPLYLLDTNLPFTEDAWITGQLYGWFGEERIAQEMILGIGGVRALRKLGIEVDIYHFNEGHALFAGFELVKENKEAGMEHAEAVQKAKEQIVFTTHTPVIQGNESHYLDRLMYMGAHNEAFTRRQLQSLGGKPFNMTVGALRLSRKSNAVAQLHGKTANQMWKGVRGRSKIVGITNGVHLGTWVDPRMVERAENGGDLWEAHTDNKQNLLSYIKEHNGVALNPEGLLIGFARRSVAYKRANLLLSNRELIEPYLKEGKIQIVYSGKSHPLDDGGKALIEEIYAISQEFPQAVVYLQNYDMTIGSLMVRGSDIWLNNPRRPKEASGTSGMKAAMNGVLNVSILDGWWPEACEHGVNGWQFGDAFESENVEEQDKHDREALYKVLLEEVVPTFFDNREKWLEMMKASILSTKDEFSVKRMLEEYYEHLY